MIRNFTPVVLVALASTVMAAPLHAEEMWLPVTAEGQGLKATYWTGPGCFLNPSPEVVEVSLTYLPWGQDNSTVAVPPYEFVLAGAEEHCVDNVFSLFGESPPGQGSVWIVSSGLIFVATRLQTDNPAGAGSYGQYVEGIPNDLVLPAETPVYLTGLTGNESFRSNVGMLNVSPTTSIALSMELYDAQARLIGADAFFLKPREGQQLTEALGPNYFDVAPIDGAYLKIISTGDFLAYLSKVDAGGDPTYVPGSTAPEATELFVPTAVLADGEAGTRWYTAVDALNTTDHSIAVKIEYWPRSMVATNPVSRTLDILAGHQYSSANIIEELFNRSEGAAAFRITASAPGVLVNTRTYNRAPGHSETFGQFIPGLPSTAALTPGFKGTLALVSEVDEQWRTNLIALNTGATPVRLHGRLATTDGATAGNAVLEVPARSYEQFGHVTDYFVNGAFEQGYLELFLVDGEGPVFILGSKVEHHTGDPIAEMVKLSPADNPFVAIDRYTVSPDYCDYPGCEVTHSWQLHRADSASIACDDGFSYSIPSAQLDVGAVSQTHTQSTACRLTARNAYGELVSAPVSVEVGECPAAVFVEGSVTPTSGDPPLSVVASATFEHAEAVEFTFDSGLSWTTVRTHTFAEAGEYPVYARALFCEGQVSPFVHIGTVNVNETCAAPVYRNDGAVNPASGTVNDTVFAASASFSGQVDSVEWAWGDGTPWSTASTHSYSSEGTFQVRVRARGCGEVVGPYVVTNVTVSETCAAPVYENDGTVTPASGSVGETVFVGSASFSGQVDAVEWAWGDGSGWSTSSTHTYSTAGTYDIRVRAYGCGQGAGPYVVATVSVSGTCDPPDYRDDGSVTPASGTASETVFEADASFSGQVDAVEWDWGDGSGWTASTSYAYAAEGTYEVKVRAHGCGRTVGPYSVAVVTVVSSTCEDPEFQNGNLIPDSGVVGETFLATSRWTGDVDSLEYDFGDDTGWSSADTHQYAAAGRYTVRVRAFGCGDVFGPSKVGSAVVAEP